MSFTEQQLQVINQMIDTRVNQKIKEIQKQRMYGIELAVKQIRAVNSLMEQKIINYMESFIAKIEKSLENINQVLTFTEKNIDGIMQKLKNLQEKLLESADNLKILFKLIKQQIIPMFKQFESSLVINPMISQNVSIPPPVPSSVQILQINSVFSQIMNNMNTVSQAQVMANPEGEYHFAPLSSITSQLQQNMSLEIQQFLQMYHHINQIQAQQYGQASPIHEDANHKDDDDDSEEDNKQSED